VKRPEGFDDRAGTDDRSASADTGERTGRATRPARRSGFRSALDGAREARRGSRTSAPRDGVAASTPAADEVAPVTPESSLPELPEVDLTEDVDTRERVTAPEPVAAPEPIAPHVPHETPIGARVRAAETAREARIARKRRRLLERAEVRRFTRRSRHRRAAWITAGGIVVVLAASILVAVFSPLMALRTIEVRGTNRVDASQVRAALSGQLGTPLARIDLGEVKREIAGFPLIESYVTEEEPPHTLVVTVTERTPVVAVQSGKTFDLVDPAGIVVQSTTKRPDGMPVADIGRAALGTSVFRTMTEVVLAMPASVRDQVSGIAASTSDDVTLTMSDGSSVVWGSPDDSAAKATLLAALVKDHEARAPDTKVEYDVSAPDNGIIRPQG
jgi:cell division septal protein FtsQ